MDGLAEKAGRKARVVDAVMGRQRVRWNTGVARTYFSGPSVQFRLA
jgi:hypothetical protein